MQKGTCYSYDNTESRFIRDPFYQPCASTANGEYTQCCQRGTYCLSDGLCQFTSKTSRNTSQYFAAECTDPTGQAEVCKSFCRNSNTYTYVKWLGDVWQCCYGERDGEGGCENPVGEGFSAPPPAQLSTSTFLVNSRVAAAVLSTAIPPKLSQSGITDKSAVQSFITSAIKEGNEPSWFADMPTAVQTFYVAPSLLPQPTNKGDSNSSRDRGASSDLGVKIGVPVAIVVILILLGVGLGVFLKRRRRRRQDPAPNSDHDSYESMTFSKTAVTETASLGEAKPAYSSPIRGRAELPGAPMPFELDSRSMPGELSGASADVYPPPATSPNEKVRLGGS